MALATIVGITTTIGATAALPAAPTSAATAVTFCFKFNSSPEQVYSNKPVYPYQRLPGGSVGTILKTGQTGANGCGTFYNVPGWTDTMVRAYYNTGFQIWDGWSQYYASIVTADTRGCSRPTGSCSRNAEPA